MTDRKENKLLELSPEQLEAHYWGRRMLKRLWLGVAIIVLGFYGMGYIYFNNFDIHSHAEDYSVRHELRAMDTALEAYYIDNNAYPAWAIGPLGANANAPDNSPYATVPTFRVKQEKNDPLCTLTTPVNYLDAYTKDRFATPSRIGLTFAYWTPTDEGWILWSPGPDRVFDIIDPAAVYDAQDQFPSDTLIQLAYDPSNGTTSSGDIWRVKQ